MRRLAAVKKNPVMADGAYSLKALDGQDILTGAWEESCGREGGTLEEARENRKIRLAGIFSLKGRAAEVKTDLPDGTYGTEVQVKGGKLICQGEPMILEC